ncbi:MAG: hypothetical protein IT480_06515 [Gammaproteobacteria bacterium]|nr:hypothetical protein [Gammaproteobacteria bacterium]
MSNSILSNTVITREAARVLHQAGNFIGGVNRNYRDEFAKAGMKAGSSINMRLPAKYTVRTSKTFTGQDHVERSTPLAVLSQYGVDVSFSTADRTLSLDDFSKRVLQPAMKQIAAKIEYDALASMYKSVWNGVGATTNGKIDYRGFQKAGQSVTENLAPVADRTALLTPASVVEFLDATKGLFAAKSNLDEQFREGIMGRTGGFDVGENTLLPPHTTGSLAGSAVTTGTTLGVTTTTNAWSSTTDLSITGATAGTTVKAGDIFTLSGVYAVHPESKANTGKLQQFVAQADVTLTTSATAYAVTVKPAMIYGSGNAFQNCTLSGVSNTSGLTVTRLGAASTAFAQDLFFHKDAYAIAFVDLEDVSSYGASCTRAQVDDVSIRFIQQYSSTSDDVIARFDVLWGGAPLLPELACRLLTTQSLLV